MKQISLIMVIVFWTYFLNAQNNHCFLEKTTWEIKNFVVKRNGETAIDSVQKVKFYIEFDSVRFCFDEKKLVTIAWKQYCSKGKYKILNAGQEQSLRITLKRLSYYDYGSVEKISFGHFLYEVSYSTIYFLNDCSFVMVVNATGLETKIFFEKMR